MPGFRVGYRWTGAFAGAESSGVLRALLRTAGRAARALETGNDSRGSASRIRRCAAFVPANGLPKAGMRGSAGFGERWRSRGSSRKPPTSDVPSLRAPSRALDCIDAPTHPGPVDGWAHPTARFPALLPPWSPVHRRRSPPPSRPRSLVREPPRLARVSDGFGGPSTGMPSSPPCRRSGLLAARNDPGPVPSAG